MPFPAWPFRPPALPPLATPADRDVDYWLCRAEGFEVFSLDERRLGVVSELRYTTRIDRPSALVVRGGWLARRRLLVPTDAVRAVVPHLERLVVAAGETEALPAHPAGASLKLRSG